MKWQIIENYAQELFWDSIYILLSNSLYIAKKTKQKKQNKNKKKTNKKNKQTIKNINNKKK